MRYKTQQWLCVMISMMICLALMGALNYLFARVRMFEQLPFSWENKDAVGFERLPGSPDIHFRDIIDIDTDREVTIISVDREQRAMGLYDPALFSVMKRDITEWQKRSGIFPIRIIEPEQMYRYLCRIRTFHLRKSAGKWQEIKTVGAGRYYLR